MTVSAETALSGANHHFRRSYKSIDGMQTSSYDNVDRRMVIRQGLKSTKITFNDCLAVSQSLMPVMLQMACDFTKIKIHTKNYWK